MSSGQVRAVPFPEQERYVTSSQLAELMGVSTRTVNRMAAEGMPSETWGVKVRRFKPSVALAWARQRGIDGEAT